MNNQAEQLERLDDVEIRAEVDAAFRDMTSRLVIDPVIDPVPVPAAVSERPGRWWPWAATLLALAALSAVGASLAAGVVPGVLGAAVAGSVGLCAVALVAAQVMSERGGNV